MTRSSLPFYENTKDDTHCYQAVLRMALKHFEPEVDWTLSALDLLSAKRPGKYTWATASVIALLKKGYDVKGASLFDSERFVELGEKYLIEFYGVDDGNVQIQNCNVAQEIRLTRQLNRLVPPEVREPDLQEVQKLLDDGYVVITNVNSRALNGLDGYVGHFVVVLKVGDDGVEVHDPGLPPQANRVVPKDVFDTAWAGRNKRSRNTLAVRRPNHSKSTAPKPSLGSAPIRPS